MYQRDARAGAFLGGDRVSGQDIRDQNGMFLTHWSFKYDFLTLKFSHGCTVNREHREKFVRSFGIRQNAGGQYWSSSSSFCSDYLSTNAYCLESPPRKLRSQMTVQPFSLF